MILEEFTQSVLAIAATAMILTLFLRMVAVSAGSCCGRLSDGKTRIETVPVLWRLCQNPEAQGRQVLRGLLRLWGQRWCCLGERLARYTLCCTGAGCKALERP